MSALVSSSISVPTQPITSTSKATTPSADESCREAFTRKIILGRRNCIVTIGRSSSCMLQVGAQTTTISRSHASIKHLGNRFELHVLGLNGVRVNGALHLSGSIVDLHDGDHINFVGAKYTFQKPEEPVEEPAEEWWPEPVVRKRKHESLKHLALPSLPSEGELYENSTDTLVATSEIGVEHLGKSREMPKFIDDLPPSSPPPMSSLLDLMDDDEHSAEMDSVLLPHTIEHPVPAQAVSTTEPSVQPAVEPAKPIPAVPKSHASSEPTHHDSTEDKENIPHAKAQKTHSAGKRRSIGTKRKVVKRDDEMMKSLRELLGVVDPSECLADAVDSETEDFLSHKPAEPLKISSGTSLVDLIVSTMVFSARTSHTISDLLRDLSKTEQDAESMLWRHHVTWALFHNRCFGRVERRVKDASDRRAEDRWYYDAQKDECSERRENFGGLVRTARRCTLRDTQYFFKQVPKLPSFRYK